MAKNNQKALDKLLEDLLYIHEDIKQVIAIDTEIAECLLKKNRYSKEEILDKNFHLYLEYSKYVLEDVTEQLDDFKLANIKTHAEELALIKDKYAHLTTVKKPSGEEIEAAAAVYDTVLELKTKITGAHFSLEKEETMKFVGLNLGVDAIVTAIYIGLVFNSNTEVGTKITLIAVLGYILFVIWFGLRRLTKTSARIFK